MPQQMKTKPVSEAADDLPELTAQQSEFVRHLLAGKTASDAYRLAYDAENMRPNTIWARASELRANSKVAAWMAAARKAELGLAFLTREQYLLRLDAAEQKCWDSGNAGAAVGALKAIGDVLGYNVQLVADVTPAIDRAARLKAIAESNPDLADMARAIAAKHGIEWAKPEHETAH